jgi:hypothetical protein
MVILELKDDMYAGEGWEYTVTCNELAPAAWILE